MPGMGPGYVVDVQADLLSGLKTRAVVPLLPSDRAPKPMSNLNPVFDLFGEPYILVTQSIASVASRELKPAVMSLTDQHDRIIRALDFLFSGY